jgi:hypothetical protein
MVGFSPSVAPVISADNRAYSDSMAAHQPVATPAVQESADDPADSGGGATWAHGTCEARRDSIGAPLEKLFVDDR